MKIGFVLGTRPEVLKLGLIYNEMEKLLPGSSVIIDTQQQLELKNIALNDLNIVPQVIINKSPGFSLCPNLAHMQIEIDKFLNRSNIHCMIVQGDTLSALAGAITAFYRKIPVIHIEAGLRSHSLKHPFPEEAHRRMIGCITDLHFAPNKQAVLDLQSEGINSNKIILAGNPLLDIESKTIKDNIKVDVLITLHRRENHENIHSILNEIVKTACKYPQFKFLILKHSHPIILKAIEKIVKYSPNNLLISDPLPHSSFIDLVRKCRLILTDSGGVQEEAAHWDIPTLILREVSDRPDGIKAGTTHVIGTDKNNIKTNMIKQLNSKSKTHLHSKPTHASKHIAKQIIKFIQNQ